MLFAEKSLTLEELFVGGKLACWYFYFQLLVVVSAGFGESTFSYGTGGKLLGLNADRSKGLAVVECFLPMEETLEPIFTVRKALQPWKALVPMEEIFLAMVTCLSFRQFLKAPEAMAVTL